MDYVIKSSEFGYAVFPASGIPEGEYPYRIGGVFPRQGCLTFFLNFNYT